MQNRDVPLAAAELDASFSPALNLSDFLHERGINMRYIARVAACCRNEAARAFLEQERVVRAAKLSIRALWASHAKSEAHAVAIANEVIARLRRGDVTLWSRLLLPEATTSTAANADDVPTVAMAEASLPPAWAWEERLRAAIGLRANDTLSHKVKSVRPPPFAPLADQEAQLLAELEFRRAAGRDVSSVQLRLVELYLVWSNDHDDPSDSFAKGERVLAEVIARHRNGTPVPNALATAGNWHLRRGQFAQALVYFDDLLDEQRATLGRTHTVAKTLSSIGEALTVRRLCPCGWPPAAVCAGSRPVRDGSERLYRGVGNPPPCGCGRRRRGVGCLPPCGRCRQSGGHWRGPAPDRLRSLLVRPARPRTGKLR